MYTVQFKSCNNGAQGKQNELCKSPVMQFEQIMSNNWKENGYYLLMYSFHADSTIDVKLNLPILL